jgi:PII-like signaling protein
VDLALQVAFSDLHRGDGGAQIVGHCRQREQVPRAFDVLDLALVVENEAKLRAVLPVFRPMIAQGIVVLADAEVVPPA